MPSKVQQLAPDCRKLKTTILQNICHSLKDLEQLLSLQISSFSAGTHCAACDF
jgi:hypothetical protein